ncbi:hypothetical protein FGG78_31190, partial [Thioclava sp. BHET1]
KKPLHPNRRGASGLRGAAMLEGLYKTTFETPLGKGVGVAYLHAGRVHGGDSGMSYVGTYRVHRDRLSADVEIATHTPGAESNLVFGVEKARIKIRARINTGLIIGEAVADTAPDVPMTMVLRPIGNR